VIVTATNAKNRFGEVIETARTEPVHVQKNGRDVAVVISPEEYRRLQEGNPRSKVRPAIDELLTRSIERRKSLYEALAK
jgi:prevent-host-death family protein